MRKDRSLSHVSAPPKQADARLLQIAVDEVQSHHNNMEYSARCKLPPFLQIELGAPLNVKDPMLGHREGKYCGTRATARLFYAESPGKKPGKP